MVHEPNHIFQPRPERWQSAAHSSSVIEEKKQRKYQKFHFRHPDTGFKHFIVCLSQRISDRIFHNKMFHYSFCRMFEFVIEVFVLFEAESQKWIPIQTWEVSFLLSNRNRNLSPSDLQPPLKRKEIISMLSGMRLLWNDIAFCAARFGFLPWGHFYMSKLRTKSKEICVW